MLKGIIRGVFGGLALAVAAHNAWVVEDFKSMTPNEIADRKISDHRRKEFTEIKQAIDERSGPVFDGAARFCRHAKEEPSKAFTGHSLHVYYASKAILSYSGQSTAFNMDLCVKNRIIEAEARSLDHTFRRPIPEKGKATEEYKNYMVSTHTNGTYVAGALGGILALSGVAAFVRSNRKQPSPT